MKVFEHNLESPLPRPGHEWLPMTETELNTKLQAVVHELADALRGCEQFLLAHADMNDLSHPDTRTQKLITATHAVERTQMKVTVTFKREETDDSSDADLSYLDGERCTNDAERAEDAERKAAFYRGEWYVIRIRAVTTIWIERPGYRTCYLLESPGLWREVDEQECEILRKDIEAIRSTTVEYKT